MTIGIVCDSTAYLPEQLVAEHGIDVVSLWVNDGPENRRELDVDFDGFYRRLADTKVLPTSSQPSPEETSTALRAALDAGEGQALGIFLSSKMSGTVESARLVAGMLTAEDPGARIEIVDSESNCMQLGFAVLAAARTATAGGSLEECVAAVEHTKRRTRFLFTPHSLEYLRRGGRIGNASALVGSVLQITPLLTVEDGVTTTAARVRTRQKALGELTARFTADVERCGLADVVVHAIADIEAAEQFARERIEPIAGRPVPVVHIGPVIGLHVGPAVGVAYETVEPLR